MSKKRQGSRVMPECDQIVVDKINEKKKARRKRKRLANKKKNA